RVLRRGARLAEHGGQILGGPAHLAPADRLVARGTVHPRPPPAPPPIHRPPVEPGPARPPDGDEPESLGRRPVLNTAAERRVQHPRTAERVRPPSAGHL